MSKDVKKYKEIVKTIYYKRWFGNLTQDEEGEVAEILDDIWRRISKKEQEDIEKFIRKENFWRKVHNIARAIQQSKFLEIFPYFLIISYLILFLIMLILSF